MIALLEKWLAPRRARWLFWIALLGVSTLAFMPSDEVPPISTGWDKSNHALAFFVLALLAAWSWPRVGLWKQAIALVGYGIFIEIVQYFVGRDAAALDVFADAIGIALHGVLFFLLVRRRVAMA
jgi:VanZ family protein